MKKLAATLAASLLAAIVALGFASAGADAQEVTAPPSDYHQCLSGGWQVLADNFGKAFVSQQACTEFVGLGGIFGSSSNDYNAGIFLTNETGRALTISFRPGRGEIFSYYKDCAEDLNSSPADYIFKPHESFRFNLTVVNGIIGYCAARVSLARWVLWLRSGTGPEQPIAVFSTATRIFESGWNSRCDENAGYHFPFTCRSSADGVWNTLNLP